MERAASSRSWREAAVLARCPSEDELVQFTAGRTPADARHALELHLDVCHRCVALLGTAARSRSYQSIDSTALEDSSPPDVTALDLENYELIRCLGHGGGGVVYEACDRVTGDRVALKTISGQTPEAAGSVRREIRALYGIRHPGVVRIRAEGSSSGVPFYVMELIDGPHLAARFSSHAHGVEDGQGLTILRRIASTLAFIHGQGWVHCDLTPRNIVLRDSESPVLVDFGLAAQFPAAIGRDPLEVGGRMAGTPSYMAPEQIRGELVDARADLYALGCILYEWLTGSPPFQGRGPDEILRRHLGTVPLAPSCLAPGIPDTLDRLTMRLLAKVPSDRVGYAAEVSAALGALGAKDWEDAPPVAPHGYVCRPAFVGRADCLRELDDFFQRGLAGAGDALFIRGVSGAGKTRLLAEAATCARRLRFRIAVAEGASTVPGPSSLVTTAPLYPLRPMLKELYANCRSDSDKARSLRRACASVLSECEQVSDVLEDVHGASPGALAGDAARARLFLRLRHILECVAEDGPLLLVIDDLQWADDLTLEFLRCLPASFFDRLPVLLLGAYRQEEESLALRAVLDRTRPRQLTLGRMDDDSILAMARDMLGVRSIPATFTDVLARQSDGNPFFVGEYVRMAVESGWLRRTPEGTWLVVERPLESQPRALDVPSSLRQLIGRRLAMLSADALTLGELGAVLGRSFRLDVLAKAAHGMGMPAVLDATNELFSRQILQSATGDELSFVHDSIRETAYALLTSDRCRQLHRDAAVALTAPAGDTAVRVNYATLAYHWERAEEPRMAMDCWDRAGAQAVTSAAYGDAIRYFEASLRLGADEEAAGRAIAPERWADRYRSLGEACYCIGDVTKCEAYLLECLRHAGFALVSTGDRRFGLQLGRSVLQQVRNRARSRRAVRHTEAQRARLSCAALAAARLAYIRVWRNDSLATLGAAFLAVNLADELPSPPTSRPYAQAGLVAGLARLRAYERHYFDRAVEVAERLQSTCELAQAYYTEGYLRAGEGRWGEAERLGLKAIAVTGVSEQPQDRETALAALACMARWQGKYDLALSYAEEIRKSATAYGNVEHEVWSIVISAGCLIRMNRHRETLEPLQRALGLLQDKSEWVCELRAHAHLAHAHHGLGNWSESATHLDRAMQLLETANGPPSMVSALDAIVSIAHVSLSLLEHRPSGRIADRSMLLGRARRALGFSRKLAILFPIAMPAYLVCRGRLELLLGRPRAARRLVARAAAGAKRLRVPIDDLFPAAIGT